MPLQDGFHSEKKLAQTVDEIMPHLIQYFSIIEANRYVFMLFVFDIHQGIMRYASDVDRRDAIIAMKKWIAEEEKTIETDKILGKVEDEDNIQ